MIQPSMKRSLISCVAALLYYSGIIYLYELVCNLSSPEGNVRILMYHRVLQNTDVTKDFQQGLFVTQKIFDEQLLFLSQNYNVISLEQAYNVFKTDNKFSRRTVVITFDDGWGDNYTNAYPILKKYKLPATIFLTTDFIDTNQMYWFYQLAYILNDSLLSESDLKTVITDLIEDEKIPEEYHAYMLENISNFINIDFYFISFLKNLKMNHIKLILSKIMLICQIDVDKMYMRSLNLTWKQVKEMSQNNISFGSHGKSHQIMTTLSQDEIIAELSESKNMIEDKIEKNITFYAYPNGNHNTLVKDEVKSAGYTCALTTSKNMQEEKIDIFSLHRIGIHQGMTVNKHGNFSKSLFSLKTNMANSKYNITGEQ